MAELTDEVLTAQAFVFFVAGFETTATTLSYALLLLAGNNFAQEKLRREVEEAKSKHGDITYQALKEMTYLDACILGDCRITSIALLTHSGLV